MVWFGLSFGLTKLLQFFFVGAFAFLLSPEKFGVFDLILTFIAVSTTLIGFSLENAVARHWWDEELKLRRSLLLSSAAMFQIVCSIVVLLAAYFIISGNLSFTEHLLSGDDKLLLSVAIVPLISGLNAVGNLALMVLRLERLYKKYSIQNISLFGLNLVIPLMIFLIIGELQFSLIVGMLASSSVFAGLGCFYCRRYLHLKVSLHILIRELKFSIPLLPAVFLDWFNQQTDRFILYSSMGITFVAQFGFVTRFAFSMFVFVQLFQLFWFPKAMSIIDKKDFQEYFRKSLDLYLSLSLLMIVVLVLFLPPLLTFVFGNKYGDISSLICFLLVAIAINGASNILNVGAIRKKNTYWNIPILLITASINATVTYLCISSFGIIGAALGTAFAYLCMALMYLLNSYLQVKMVFNWQSILVFLIGCSLVILSQHSELMIMSSLKDLIEVILLTSSVIFMFRTSSKNFSYILR